MSSPTDTFYNTFSYFYPVVDLFLNPLKRKLFEEINNSPSGRLLEIGVGNGRHLSLYKTHQIAGIDTSLKMLQRAERHKDKRIELHLMNGESLLFQDQSFDYVVLSHVIAVVDNPEKLLEEAYRVLKPTGKIFILNHFTSDNWTKHIDNNFQVISKAFHFRSVFHINHLETIRKFELLKEVSVGAFSYFRLLIYSKA